MKTDSNEKTFQDNGISAVAFAPKLDYCVIATKKDHVARLFKIGKLEDVNSWKLIQEFKEHSQTIGDIDWSSDYKIITSSHDRSVVVWNKTSETRWEKMLVNIDLKLSILVSKWSPNPKKFALGSGCCTLALGFYSLEEKCWVVRAKSNFTKAPITTLSFHPSSNILAIGAADFSIKIITSSFKGSKQQHIIESSIEDTNYKGPFQKHDTIFEQIFKIENLGGWINHLSFQNNGSSLLVIPHTNHVKIYEIADNEKVVVGEEDIKWKQLPFLSGYINDKKQLLLGGFNKKVAKFTKQGNYVFNSYLTENQKSKGGSVKGGLVSQFAKGIEKKSSLFGNGPNESEHVNAIKVIATKGSPISYDVSGVIHIWQ